MIAPMWDDHNPAASNSDAVYYQTVDSETFVVQWNQLLPYGNNQQVNLVTFQLILKRDGTIIYQYLQMNSEEEIYSYTIGMENSDETQVVLVSYRRPGQTSVNPDYAHPLMALRFNPLASWVAVSETSVVVPANGSATVDLTFDSTSLTEETVESQISFSFSDVSIGEVIVPVSITVSDNQAPTARAVSIQGTALVGETLSAQYTYDDAENDLQGDTQIEWMQGQSETGPFGVLATGATYTLQESDYGSWLKVHVTPVSQQEPTHGNSVDSAAFGPISAPPVFDGLPIGLVGYWPFDDQQNPTVDASGNGRDATLQSGTDLVPGGHAGDAIQVTGPGGAISDTEHLVFGDFTIVAWVKHAGAYTSTTNELLFSKGWDLYFGIDTHSADGKLRVQFKHNNGEVSNAHLDNAKTIIPPDTWTHVAAIRRGSEFLFYINGVQLSPDWSGSASTNQIDSNSTAMAIGHNPLSSDTWWRGFLDDVQLYNRALLHHEMVALFSREPDVKLAWETGNFASLPGGAQSPEAASEANPDGDSFNNLMEFAFRSDPLAANVGDQHFEHLVVQEGSNSYLEIRYTRRRGVGSGSSVEGYSIDGITYVVERSLDLQPNSWDTGSLLFEEVLVVDNGDGTERVKVRSKSAISLQDAEFIRLRIQD